MRSSGTRCNQPSPFGQIADYCSGWRQRQSSTHERHSPSCKIEPVCNETTRSSWLGGFGIDGESSRRHRRLRGHELVPQFSKQIQRAELRKRSSVGISDPPFLLVTRQRKAHKDDLASRGLDRLSGSIRKIRRDGRLRGEGEDQGVPRLGSFMENCEPELFAQLDEPLTPEREDGRHGIDHQMIVEQPETGERRQLSGNRELSRSSRPIQEKEFHPQRLDPTSRSENHKLMTLDANEFIRRFLIHVLPDGFHRIRHYGLFANANRANNIALARRLLAVPDPTPSSQASDHAENGRDDEDWKACPCCGRRMIIVEAFEPGCQPRFWPVPSIGLDSS